MDLNKLANSFGAQIVDGILDNANANSSCPYAAFDCRVTNYICYFPFNNCNFSCGALGFGFSCTRSPYYCYTSYYCGTV